MKELRELVALAVSGEPIAPVEHPLEAIHEVYRRLMAGEIEGPAVVTPARRERT